MPAESVLFKTLKTNKPGALDKGTQEVFQMINSGAKYRNIENFPNFRLGHELSEGPASIPGKALRLTGDGANVKFVMQDTPHVPTMAHEMGHMLAGHGTGGAGEILLNRAPIISELYLPFREMQANHNGAKLLKKIYADNPEMVRKINRDMYIGNLGALATYSTYSAGNLAGATIGGLAGNTAYNARRKKYDENVNAIQNNRLLSPEEKKKRIKQLGYAPNRLVYTLGGGTLGYAGGLALGVLPNAYAASRISGELNGVLSKSDKEFINMMKAHAKKHGYDKDVMRSMNPQGWGDPARAVELRVPAELAKNPGYARFANVFVD